MVKMKLKIRLCVILSMCFFSLVVSGSEAESKSTLSETSPNPVPVPVSSGIEHLEGLVTYFKAAEEKDREQSKVIEELKDQLKSLSDKFEKFKEKISSDHRVVLLTPRLRGPPGRDGKCKEKPETVKVGPSGSKEEQVIPDPQPSSLKSCGHAMEILPSPRSQKQWIYPHGNTTKVEVLCDFDTDGGGWTAIQKRSSGPRLDFDRNWNEYSNGFGSLSGNFWLGLENIYALTKNGDQELRIELEDFEGRTAWAKYSSFSLSEASDFYRLNMSGFSPDSTAGDSLNYHNEMRFSTKDKDNDNDPSGNCVDYYGAWWHNACSYSGLNGFYREKGETGNGIYWYNWKNNYNSHAKSVIKIRQRKSE